MNLWGILALGLLLHIVFFFGIFEIYFATPLASGMQAHRSPLPAPARRLVFIIADGLRADKILELLPDGGTPAPYLRNIIETQGGWGVAHAAVPTATRPGHVALTAGFYEDPTSVAKDLQDKSVGFDTVFNESRYTWSWDTPKFLAKVTGGNGDRMFSEKYPGHMKWLAGINALDMDSWVFNEAQALFQRAKTDEELKKLMSNDEILFFLHLGGLDHSGYIVRPSSPAYLEHITYVDNGVRDFVKTVEEHYQHDGKTAYVFASDHGMTDWGGHGDGTPDETLTPLIAWGPGLRKPEKETRAFADGLSNAWSLTKWKRTDIDQASMAAFLASIVGIPFPKNAVKPVPDNMFNITDHEMSEMLFANMRQLMAQVEALMLERMERSIKFAFSPFLPLTPIRIVEIQNSVTSLISKKQYRQAISESKMGINLAMQGIRYYTVYDRNSLWFAVTSSMVGWMVYLITTIYEDHDTLTVPAQGPQLSRRYKGLIVMFFAALSVIIFIVLYVQSSVWTNFVYMILPCPIWLAVCLRFDLLRQMTLLWPSVKPLVPYCVLTFVGIQAVVIGFYTKEVISFGMLCFAAWPWLMKRDQVDKSLLIQWSVSCVVIAIFAGIPRGTRELNFNLVVLGGILAIAVACFVMRTFAKKQLARRKLFLIYGFQLVLIAAATFIAKHTADRAANNLRTQLVSQIMSWLILGLGLLSPFLVTTDIRCRLFTIALGLLAPYIMFSISYEVIFVVLMCWNLYVWMLLEINLAAASEYKEVPTAVVMENGNGHNGKANGEIRGRYFESMDFATMHSQISNGKSRHSLVRADLRRAFYYLFVCVASLYGTTLTTSVASFDVAAVFCYLTVSNPPIMGTLIVMKIVVPTLMAACALRAINLVLRVPMKSLLLMVIFFSEVVFFQFFLVVTDEGSWEHVGQVTSHSVIYQGLHIMFFVMFGVSYFLTTCNICCFRSKL